MATIKSFTDLSQSKKLAEILPLKSADMYWFEGMPNIGYSKISQDFCNKTGYSYIACWSLASLLDVLPEGTRLLKSTNISSIGDTKYHCDCPKGNIDEWFDNPVDACVTMIEKLKELNLL